MFGNTFVPSGTPAGSLRLADFLLSLPMAPVINTWTDVFWRFSAPNRGKLNNPGNSELITTTNSGMVYCAIDFMWVQVLPGKLMFRSIDVNGAGQTYAACMAYGAGGIMYQSYTLSFGVVSGAVFKFQCLQDSDAVGIVNSRDLPVYGSSRAGLILIDI